MNDLIEIQWHEPGFGFLGLDGNMGFGNIRVVPPKDLQGWQFLSIHAPCKLQAEVKKPIHLAGFYNTSALKKPESDAVFLASGNYIGRVDKIGESTLSKYGDFILWAGVHLLEIALTTEDRQRCHTVWAYKNVD